MNTRNEHIYEFGDFCIDAVNHLLLRRGRPVPLKPKAFDTLLILVKNRGRVIEKDELMELLWADTFVEEANLTQNIYELRKVLGESAREPYYIENVPKRGYRFVGEVKESVVAKEADKVEEDSDKTIKSLAVLPFKPLITEERDEFLEIGIADTLITGLSGIGQIIVRPISAIRKYADSSQDPLAAGREMKVDTVLEGSVQKSGDRLRVNVRLLSVRDESTIWADKFDENFTDIFTLQDSISEKVAAALSLKLTSEGRLRLTKRHTENAEVHQLFLKCRYYWHKWTPESWQKSIEYGSQAVSLDPTHAPSYSWMGASYCTLGIFGIVSPKKAFTKARELVEKALSLDPTLSEAHEVLGAIKLFYEWDLESVAGSLTRAFELNPSNATARDLYALYLTAIGRANDAVSEVRRALEIDPLSLIINTDVGYILYFARRYRQAVEQLQKTLELDPFFAHARYALGFVYLQEALFDEAIAEINKAVVFSEREAASSPELGYAYAIAGRSDEAREVLTELEEHSKRGYVDPYHIALIYIGLDDKNRAFEWLRRAYKGRSREVIYLKANPVCDPLRSDPRFLDLLWRVGLEL
ncbi:MAG: winged helix-turn-helix domain-containing protein [Acidobacteria bacterium]|nr:winged helix-turn-helix domain-containing protein [Acidobacteriota bacterium]MCA1639001.1 winged helix-turn-helix domain-containing protein [Acidobacteriota bacterium]